MKKIITFVFVSGALFFLNSCSSGYVERQPETVTVIRPAAPAPHYVWVNDGYVYRNSVYVHRPGYWVRPRPNRVYVEGHWKQTPRGYRWQRGKWR